MTTRRRRWFAFSLQTLFAVVVACGLISTTLVTLVGYRMLHPARSEMLRITLLWGRLAPLPAIAQDFAITTEGGPFTRAFRASFFAPIGDVQPWLDESPGTCGITPEQLTPTTRKYLIAPGDGAQHAEVNVDDRSGAVWIYVYWS